MVHSPANLEESSMSEPHEEDKVGLVLVVLMPIIMIAICAVSIYLSQFITI